MSIHEIISDFHIKYLDFLHYDQIALMLYAVSFIVLLKMHPVKGKLIYFAPFISIYFGLVGANMFAVFFNGPDSVYLKSQEPLLNTVAKAFSPFFEYGQVMYGGFFGSVFGLLFFYFLTGLRKELLPVLLDVSAISISLLFSVWRLNCFVDGCCYGAPNELLGMVFSPRSQAFRYLTGTDLILPDESGTVPLFPSQLISFFANLLIFLFLYYLFSKKKIRYPYLLFFTQVMLYGTFRFLIEFLRIDIRERWGVLSISQWIPLFMMPFVIWYFYSNRKEIIDLFKKKI